MSRYPPSILTDAGLSLFANTLELRESSFPIVQIPIEELTWHFDMPVWEKDETDDWNLAPRDVIEGKDGSVTHRARIEKADTSFPLIVTKYAERYVILDGIHRLVKRYEHGERVVNAKVIPIEYLTRKSY